MLNKYLNIRPLTLWFILLFANSLYAVEFTASVSSNSIDVGESLELSLILTDASPVTLPDLSELNKDFTVDSQQQYSSFTNYNGSITSRTGWNLIILPIKEGKLIIPSIEVNTNKGRLRSEEISITVAKGSAKGNAAAPADPNGVGVSLIATTNKTKTYVKEPLIYTLKIITYKGLANLSLEDIKSSDAIIDKVGQPKQYTQSLGGIRAYVIEVKYYITPLVAGNIVINPAVVYGETQEPAMASFQSSNRFGLMSQMFANNAFNLKPFRVTGDKLTITAMPPAIKTNNWLPLQNLSISEEWSGLNKAKVGDTINRKIKLVANGGFSTQLPSVKEFIEVSGLKVYADKAVTTDNTSHKNDLVIGTKIENFSLVPLQEGKLTLPEVRVHWWNLRTNKVEVAILAARTIDVQSAPISTTKDATVDYTQHTPNTVIATSTYSRWLYVLVGALLVIIISMLVVIVLLLKKKKPSQPKPKANATNVYTQKEITSINDLREHIMLYANKTWRVPASLPLNNLGDFLSKHQYRYDPDLYATLAADLNAAMYSGAKSDLATMVNLWERFKRSVAKNKRVNYVQQAASDLNPT